MDAIHLPNGISLPTTFGAPGTPLQAGQVIQALVLELIESDVFRLQLPQATVDVRSDVALTPGSTVTLAVKGSGTGAKLVIYSDAPALPAQAPVRGGQSNASLAGRAPIGEATVIARGPMGQGTAPALTPGRPLADPLVHDAPSISPARVTPPQAEPTIRALTPEQAVGEAVRAAAPRQAGLAPLLADVEQMVHVPDTALAAAPAPVRAAAADVLALRVPLDEQLTASDVKQAFVRSGVLFEPRLAAVRGAPAPSDARALPPATPTEPTVATPGPGNDLKAALLVLRQVVKTWSASEPAATRPANLPLGGSAAPEAAVRPAPLAERETALIRQVFNTLTTAPDEPVRGGPSLSPEQATTLAKALASALLGRDAAPAQATANPNNVPPPYRGAPLFAQAPAAPSIAPDTAPHEAAEHLLAATDGALARQTLLQIASLPEQPDMPRADAPQRWSFEVPFATPQGTAVAQFEVSRDSRAAKADPQARVWRARFSLDVEPMGPVHAMVALTGARASVSLWAERLSTATQLNDSAPLLRDALRAAELEPADFQLRVGTPPVAAKQATPGRFMDRAS